MSAERRNKSFRARETVHVPRIALFALRTNGKSADKVSRYSEIFFTIDGADGNRDVQRGKRGSFELKSIEAFPKTNDENGTQYTGVELFIISSSLNLAIQVYVSSNSVASIRAKLNRQTNIHFREIANLISRTKFYVCLSRRET